MVTHTLKPIAPSTRAAIRRALGKWYTENRRPLPWRQTCDPYAIWVSEVMLQQTQVKTVIPYYRRFMAQFPTVMALAQADQQSVLKAWEGLGYYSRARNLHRAAAMVAYEMDGRIPGSWDDIRQLPGIGDYMAAAILSIALGQPYAVVDGNVKRVLARLFCMDAAVNQPSAHKLFQKGAQLLLDIKFPSDHNQAMMELGALVCTPRKPTCHSCPVARFCQALKSNLVDQYPQRRKRPPKKEAQWVAGVVVKRGAILLLQRPEQGLLGGLWEFPTVSLARGDDATGRLMDHIQKTTHLAVTMRQPIVTVRHAYTHFKIQLTAYLCRWCSGRVRLSGPTAFDWVPPAKLTDFPLHGAVHKVLPSIEQAMI